MSQFVRGERVYFDLDTGDITENTSDRTANDVPAPPPPTLPSAFVGDILERPTAAATPPVAPSFKTNPGGFPAHKKRTPRVSAFKQRRAAAQEQATSQAAQTENAAVTRGAATSAEEEEEERQIDEENRRRLAEMSEAEIEEERRELLESLPKSLIEKLLGRGRTGESDKEMKGEQRPKPRSMVEDLLARADIGEGSNEMDWEKKEKKKEEIKAEPPKPTVEDEEDEDAPTKSSNAKKVSFAEPEPESQTQTSSTCTDPTHNHDHDHPHGTIHFPTPSQPPELDPTSPDFLTSLHEKYFPNLPYDPSHLSWMSPIDPNDTTSPYHPSHKAYNASDLRFDFRGALLAPSAARKIPVSKGLHHHADAPEAAGYTIPELSIMARSTVPAQRCIAFQTIGRILYRLGRGEFGFEKVKRRGDGPVQQVVRDPEIKDGEEVDEEDIEVDMEDAGSAMAAGLWACVDEGRVIETLTEEAGRERGHLTARTFAQEALWNWRRGGGRKRAAV